MEEIRNPGQELPEAEAAQAAEVEAALPAEETAEASAQAEAAAEAETVQIPEPLEKPEQPERVEVVDVRFRNNAKNYYFDPNGLTLKTGDHVIIETARGDEYGLCAAGNHSVPAGEVVAPLRKVQRLATAQDEKINADNQAKEKKAFDVCMKKIEDHKLDMQLVSAECAFDGSKILFFFTAEGRVDFRELVKDLASVFRTRIELRQIGVRDKAKMVGGLGVCGRPFCCKEFLDDFQPVSIKMAKTQNLSLNPTKISGTCGRLMCCLKYEQDNYEEARKRMPRVGKDVITPDGRGHVIDINVLRETVRVRFQDGDNVEVKEYSAADVQRLGAAEQERKPAQSAEMPEDDDLPADAELTGGEEETIGEELRALEAVEEGETPAQPRPQRPARSVQQGGRQQITGRRTQRRPQGEKPQQEGEKRRPPRGEGNRRPCCQQRRQQQGEGAKNAANPQPQQNAQPGENSQKPNNRPPRRRRPNNGPRRERPQGGEQPPKKPE